MGLLLGALGFGSYGLLALNDWSQREQLSILVGGGTVGTLGLTGALIANTAYAGRVISVDQPGRWYSADEADERIDDYNAALGEPRP